MEDYSKKIYLTKIGDGYLTISNTKYTIFDNTLKKVIQLPSSDNKNYGVGFFLNRAYIVKNKHITHLIDINISRVIDIYIDTPIIESTNTNKNTPSELNLPEYSPSIQIETKIIVVSGLVGKKLSKEIISYDLSLYKFEYEKVRENNIIPRYRHGLFKIDSLIYIIGGFSKPDDSEVCDKLQVIKFDNLMNNWITIEVIGNQPVYLVDPCTHVVEGKYIMAMSNYKYPKIWYLNQQTNTGHEICLQFILKSVTFTINYNEQIELIYGDENKLNKLVLDYLN
jgi:hypothetical protein